jgi:hypothetical protein
MTVLLNDWEHCSDKEIFEFFDDSNTAESRKNCLEKQEFKNCKILLASYSFEWYDGTAFVLFERGGELFEVNGSHCSCYGLEGQWQPDETTIESLTYRLENGRFGLAWDNANIFNKELKKLLEGMKL